MKCSKFFEELLQEGVVLVGRRFKVVHMNRAACHLLGVSKGSVLKTRLGEVDHPVLRMAKGLLMQARARKEMLCKQCNIEGGGCLEVLAFWPARRKGGLLIRDRTDQMQMVEMGKAFVANASHELRTPITIIKGFAETLQDLPELSMEMLSVITEKIVRNCRRIEHLITGLLTLSDLEMYAGQNGQECDLCQLVENCHHLLMPKYPDATVTMKGEREGVMIVANPAIMELAIFNLLENAAKYSPKKAEIEVEIWIKGGEAVFEIRDHGIGIPENDLEHIFERFYTVDKARSRKLGGAGIGLSIVKTIFEKHGGQVKVASRVGEGTTFTLTLPGAKIE